MKSLAKMIKESHLKQFPSRSWEGEKHTLSFHLLNLEHMFNLENQAARVRYKTISKPLKRRKYLTHRKRR